MEEVEFATRTGVLCSKIVQAVFGEVSAIQVDTTIHATKEDSTREANMELTHNGATRAITHQKQTAKQLQPDLQRGHQETHKRRAPNRLVTILRSN